MLSSAGRRDRTTARKSSSESTMLLSTSSGMLTAVAMPSANAQRDPTARERAKQAMSTADAARKMALRALNTTTLAGKAGANSETTASSAGYPGGKCVAAGAPGRLRKRYPAPEASARERITYMASSCTTPTGLASTTASPAASASAPTSASPTRHQSIDA